MSRLLKEYDYPGQKNDTVIHKIVSTNSKRFRMSIYENERLLSFYIGGHTRFCVYAEMIKNDNGELKDMGYLYKIRYDEVCSLDNQFTRGADTQFILKFLLTYLSKTYPSVKKLAFNDASARTCNHGVPVSLASMQFILTGKTWYQKHFSAYLEGRDIQNFTRYYDDYTRQKKLTDWNMIIYRIDNLPSLGIDMQTLEQIYNQTNTWEEFFSYISNMIGIGEFCEFIYPWLDKFIKSFLKHELMGFQYMMPVKEYPIEYELLPYTKGGKRFTRKNRYVDSRDER